MVRKEVTDLGSLRRGSLVLGLVSHLVLTDQGVELQVWNFRNHDLSVAQVRCLRP